MIRDIVFNSKLVSFNNPVKFQGVSIGHEIMFDSVPSVDNIYDGQYPVHGGGPLISSTYDRFDEDRMSAMPAKDFLPESCAVQDKSMLTVREIDSLKFGDPQSNITYFQVETNEKTFYADFSLSFSFRTYYPNGILFMVARHHQTARRPVFVVALVDGRVFLRMRMGDNHYVDLLSTDKRLLNDGSWHQVTAGRNKMSLYLNVDNKDRMENGKPKRRLILKKGIVAFIGGMSNEFVVVENEIVTRSTNGNGFMPTTEGFKGCVKKFYLNEKHVSFKKYAQTSSCFVEIEKGAYFTGSESFAIYENEFNIGLKADISFEFRTTKLNSVLFSMSNGTDNETPNLSIELTENGSVLASADFGSGPLRAEHNFTTPFELCDGHWHTVKIQFTKKSISLKVDRNAEVYGLKEQGATENHIQEPFTSAPLYIGGVPQFAPSGLLNTRNSFEGCMRNIEVNEKRQDWLSYVRLNQVEPNACPIYLIH